MKKVIGMLAVVALVSSVASAELLKNFKADGKVEFNAYTTNNNTDSDADLKDKTSDVDARVQLNATFDLAEDVNAVVSAIKNNVITGRQFGENSEDANTVLSNLFFEHAYLNLKGVLGFD